MLSAMAPDTPLFLSRLFRCRVFTIATVSCLALGASLAALAPDSSLLAERVVTYTTGRTLSISAKVGPVSIQSVEFIDRGRGSSPGGFASIVARGSASSETSTTIRSHFIVENPSTDEWEVTFTLDFLDKSGKLIDRATKKAKWEGEAKPMDFDHAILQYVVPAIAEVRIKMEGRHS
jgi:hypothetical protein